MDFLSYHYPVRAGIARLTKVASPGFVKSDQPFVCVHAISTKSRLTGLTLDARLDFEKPYSMLVRLNNEPHA